MLGAACDKKKTKNRKPEPTLFFHLLPPAVLLLQDYTDFSRR
jgi:hypothetical protein